MCEFVGNCKIVLFGDSLTEQSFDVENGCWASLLANHFQRVADIISRGFSGYNSTHLKIILPEILKEFVSEEVAVFVLFLGANDCHKYSSQYVEVERFRLNYTEIVSQLKAKGFDSSKLLLITPPAYDHEKYTKYCKETGRPVPSRDISYVKSYVEEIKAFAESMNLQLINFFDEMYAQENWKDMLSDGLHISKSGAQLLFQLVLPAINDRVLSVRGTMNKRFVDWKEIDEKEPERSLKPSIDSMCNSNVCHKKLK